MTKVLRLQLLTAIEISSIYDKCLDVLSSKGVKIDYPQALKVLDKAGATVEFDTHQVRFSKDIIEMALRSVPHEFTVKGSDEKHDFVVPHPTGSFYTSTCIQTMRYHDPETNIFCDATVDKLAEWAQLTEALNNIDICAIQTPMDVPRETADVHGLSVLLQNTSKPLMLLAYCLETVDYLFELMVAKAGSVEALKERPLLLINPTSLSPFEFKPMDMEQIMHACRYGIPIAANVLPGSGGTAPITIAGTVLVACIEILAMLVMSQLVKPGIPFIGAVFSTTLDMAKGNALLGNTESMLCRAAACQFIKETFRIPVETFSFMTDSYVSDGQAMVEKALMPAMLAMAGSDIQYGAGRLGGSSTASPIQLVIDDQLVTIIKRCTSGVQINDETLAFKEILETRGDFLSLKHTLRHCRETIRPDLFVPDSLTDWESKGRKDLYARAVDKYREIRKNVRGQPLSEDLRREMNRIVKRADDRLAR